MKEPMSVHEYGTPWTHDEPTLGEELDGADADAVIEMANLPAEKTGVDGVIFISTKMGQHGPRVKYFRKPGRDQPSFSVSIEADPKVVASSLGDRVRDRAAAQVVAWVALNRAELLRFWNEGDTWLDAQVQAFKDGLKKLEA
jgi:hypothetical protein